MVSLKMEKSKFIIYKSIIYFADKITLKMKINR